MKEILQQYAAYNLWANQKMVDVILPLPGSLQNKSIVSSFKSLHLTLFHLWFVESIWWQRVNLVAVPVSPGNGNDDISEITSGLVTESEQGLSWIENKTSSFEDELTYKNLKGDQFTQPLFQVLLHLFNHQTYHRGQLVTMLGQCGLETIPATDFIAWSRNTK